VDTTEVEVSFVKKKEEFLLIFVLTETVLNGQLLSLYAPVTRRVLRDNRVQFSPSF
jgi:hypothetical protein